VLGHIGQRLLHHPEGHHLQIPVGQLGQLLAQGRFQAGAVQQRRPQVEQEGARRRQPLLQVLVHLVESRLDPGGRLLAEAGHRLVENGSVYQVARPTAVPSS
jgi:hypothetical protein